MPHRYYVISSLHDSVIASFYLCVTIGVLSHPLHKPCRVITIGKRIINLFVCVLELALSSRKFIVFI